MVELGEHFASEKRGRYSEWLRQRQWFIKAKHEHHRREELADKIDETASAISAAVTIASEPQIRDFKVKLETLDMATVHALMENQELLDIVNASIEVMLGRAHVMEDGRRVFRTEDGTQVFDEHGEEVGAEELDPDMIDPTAPTWEDYARGKSEQVRLEAELEDILDFERKVDAARERVDGGEISEADLAALDADLMEAMPNAVRSHAGIEPSVAVPDRTNSTEHQSATAPAHAQNLGNTSPAFTPL